MSNTDTPGQWDVSGLSAIDPRPRQWISVPTMREGCWHAVVLVTSPQMSVHGVGLTLKRLSSKPNSQHWGPCNPELCLA